jgi:exodeoxyribonuclease VII small subunit
VNTKKGFDENFKVLEVLAKELQGGTVSIDELIPKMKQATESIRVCKDVLKKTKIQLEEIEGEFSGLFDEDEKEL